MLGKKMPTRSNYSRNHTWFYPSYTLDMKSWKVTEKREPWFVQIARAKKYPVQIKWK